ncbi:alpha-taxilin isoform X1 [Diorhabda carinulata]|uniref:alpha-taxilin isoform X1 n=1 Tax=Diorhabda carinulata TaxID=1163345 RepID=UPI0025A0B81A|nr:alpha-taxilin isoform X1 [Diorhabda carinulata]XP_057658657.1 alpha-taxilin isoform X1 [Diorhabda carinulata]
MELENKIKSTTMEKSSVESTSGDYVEPARDNTKNTPTKSVNGNNEYTGAIKKKKDDTIPRRSQKCWDKLLKSVSSLSEIEKLEVIKEKYMDLYYGHKEVMMVNRNLEKELKAIQKEKEQIQADLIKNILSKSKLENLARELQKLNKDIKEESINKLKEEEERHKQLSTNFSEKLKSLISLMESGNQESKALRDENVNLAHRLTEVYKQFEERENYTSNLSHQLELQQQLTETRLKKAACEYAEKEEMWHQEKRDLIQRLCLTNEANRSLQENSSKFQEQIVAYQKQYHDFEGAMKRSNKVLDTFKEEMAHMKKNNSELLKDRNKWQKQWQNANDEWTRMCKTNRDLTSELEQVNKKLDVLDKLCRKLTADRASYLQQGKTDSNAPDCDVEPHKPIDEVIISSDTLDESDRQKSEENTDPVDGKSDNYQYKLSQVSLTTSEQTAAPSSSVQLPHGSNFDDVCVNESHTPDGGQQKNCY